MFQYKKMNYYQNIENRIFVCLAIIVLAIFLTGCNTTKWEWLPPKDRTMTASPFTRSAEEPSETVDVLKVSF
jgi:hypothetical protein|tara:strand:- start:320 stop:535 length:216 start_codon:yes stop_codon:yes gene_type:complete